MNTVPTTRPSPSSCITDTEKDNQFQSAGNYTCTHQELLRCTLNNEQLSVMLISWWAKKPPLWACLGALDMRNYLQRDDVVSHSSITARSKDRSWLVLPILTHLIIMNNGWSEINEQVLLREIFVMHSTASTLLKHLNFRRHTVLPENRSTL